MAYKDILDLPVRRVVEAKMYIDRRNEDIKRGG